MKLERHEENVREYKGREYFSRIRQTSGASRAWTTNIRSARSTRRKSRLN